MADINSCIRCKQPIKTGLRCTQCGRLAHKACVKLLKNAFVVDSETITCGEDVKKGVSDEICIQPETVDNAADSGAVSSIDQIRVTYLEEIIKQKDLVIMNQGIAIDALREQNNMLKQQLNKTNISTTENQQKSLYSGRAKEINKTNGKNVLPQNSDSSKPSSSKATIKIGVSSSKVTPTSSVTTQDVAGALHNIEARRICDDIVNLEKDKTLDKASRPRGRRNLLVGTGVSSNKCPFKAASYTRINEYYATNFELDVDEKELCEYLREFAPKVTVNKLLSRNPDKYSCFKISVPADEADKIMVAGIWPEKVFINRFFLSRQHQAQL